MIHLWKEVLLPGWQRDKNGKWFFYSPADVQQSHQNFTKMLSRGVPLPGVWEHQNVEAGDPEAWKANYAKNTFCHMGESRVRTRTFTDGKGILRTGPVLELRHDIPRRRDAQQLLVTKFVSPKVYRGYSDSAGGQYRGTTIAHVAATPTPVQFWQRPFELSKGDAVYLSYGGDAMDKEKEEKTEKPKEEKTEKKEPPKEEVETDDEGSGGEFQALCDALTEKGFVIPEGVDDLCKLTIAIKANSLKDSNVDPDLDAGLNADSTANTTGAGSPPMLMSSTSTDKKVINLAKSERKDLDARVVGLFNTGRISRLTAHKLRQRIKGVEMSFTSDGYELQETPLHHQIAGMERDIPKGAVWSATGERRVNADELSTAEPDDPEGRLETMATGNQSASEKAVIARQEEYAKQWSVKPAAK